MRAWAVTGRIPGDDDDTLELVTAETEQAAHDAFKAHLLDIRDKDDADASDLVAEYGHAVFITGTILIGHLSHAGAVVTLDPSVEFVS